MRIKVSTPLFSFNDLDADIYLLYYINLGLLFVLFASNEEKRRVLSRLSSLMCNSIVSVYDVNEQRVALFNLPRNEIKGDLGGSLKNLVNDSI